VLETIEATEGLELTQEPPEIVELTVVVVPEHKEESNAVNTPVVGAFVTLIFIVAVAFVPKQYEVPSTVYVITAVPADIAVTKPVVRLTDAIEALELVHEPPETLELTVVVKPAHKLGSTADKVPAIGARETEISIVAEAFEPTQLPVP
jgi:hypothetical protein